VNPDCDDAILARCLQEAGIAFLYAPAMHPAMRHAATARKALGVRTVFNLLGPLTHPAGASRQLMGVFDRRWVEPVARALGELGTRRALVVHGLDGMDEITTTAPTAVAELDAGRVRTYLLDPLDLGIPRAQPDELRGGDAQVNAGIARAILHGEQDARRSLVVVNAGAALWAAGKAADLREGMTLAERALDSGAAAHKLQELIRLTHSPGGRM
jgi:anthranilate phosphoribosyltransferase